MDKEPDAGWLLLIDLISNVTGVRELWKKEKGEGALPYLFISEVAKNLEDHEFSKEDEQQILEIINSAYLADLSSSEGINNFLGAGFIEALSSPDEKPGVRDIVSQLRLELQKSYRQLN